VIPATPVELLFTIFSDTDADVVYSCPAANDVALILEFQTALYEGQTPMTRAWCRVSIFNEAGWIMAGCWRLPLRSPPVDLLPAAPAAFSRKVIQNLHLLSECSLLADFLLSSQPFC